MNLMSTILYQHCVVADVWQFVSCSLVPNQYKNHHTTHCKKPKDNRRLVESPILYVCKYELLKHPPLVVYVIWPIQIPSFKQLIYQQLTYGQCKYILTPTCLHCLSGRFLKSSDHNFSKTAHKVAYSNHNNRSLNNPTSNWYHLEKVNSLAKNSAGRSLQSAQVCSVC